MVWPSRVDPSREWLVLRVESFRAVAVEDHDCLLLPGGACRWRNWTEVPAQSMWFFWGGSVYLSLPATMALALQDYQDLCFALPCLVMAFGPLVPVDGGCAIFGAVLAIAPREETVPMAVVCAVFAVPYLRQRIATKNYAINIVISLVIAGVYVWWAERYFPLSAGGHDMPLQNAVGSLGR